MAHKLFFQDIYDLYDIPSAFVQEHVQSEIFNAKLIVGHQAFKLNVLYIKLWTKIYGVVPSKVSYNEWLSKVDIKPFDAKKITIDTQLVQDFLNSLIVLKVGLLSKIDLQDIVKYANSVIQGFSSQSYLYDALVEKFEMRYGVQLVDRNDLVKSYVDISRKCKIHQKTKIQSPFKNPLTGYKLGSIANVGEHLLNDYERIPWLISNDVYFQVKLMEYPCIILESLPESLDITTMLKHIKDVFGKYCMVFVNENIYNEVENNELEDTAFPSYCIVSVYPEVDMLRHVPKISSWCLTIAPSSVRVEGLALDRSNNVRLFDDIPNESYYWKVRCQSTSIRQEQTLEYIMFIYSYMKTHAHEIQQKCLEDRSKESHKAVVIVDNRPNELSLISCKMALLNTCSDWRLVVITSDKAMAFYRDNLPGFTEIITHPLMNQGVFNIDTYNDTLQDVEFWKTLSAMGIDKTLIIQDDGLLVRPGVDKYIDYDFVGAPWADSAENVELKQRITSNLVGNGGLSLRSVEWMIRVCETYDGRETFYHNLIRMPEDVYFVKYLSELGANIPSAQEASFFAVEQIINTKALGFHKFWLYHPLDAVKDFFKTILC